MSQTSFDDRLNRITEKHYRLTSGMTYRIGPDGLIRPEPVRKVTVKFPLRPLLYLALMAYGFKILLFVGLGEATYLSRLAALQEGSTVERAAAQLMQPDPGTRALGALAEQIRAS